MFVQLSRNVCVLWNLHLTMYGVLTDSIALILLEQTRWLRGEEVYCGVTKRTGWRTHTQTSTTSALYTLFYECVHKLWSGVAVALRGLTSWFMAGRWFVWIYKTFNEICYNILNSLDTVFIMCKNKLKASSRQFIGVLVWLQETGGETKYNSVNITAIYKAGFYSLWKLL